MDPRWLEFGLFYGVCPVAFAIAAHRYDYRGAMAPLLWVISIGVGIALAFDPRFDRSLLWHVPLHHHYLITMLVRFLVLGTGLLLLGRWLAPGSFLWMPRARPRLWLLFLLAYPALSALPQGIIWRVFFVHRYAELFPGPLSLICAGAAAFSLAHLAFWNATAIAVTAIGGALFLATYLNTDSMLLATLEHGAYGLVAFSAGLGSYLYRGAPAPRLDPQTQQRVPS